MNYHDKAKWKCETLHNILLGELEMNVVMAKEKYLVLLPYYVFLAMKELQSSVAQMHDVRNYSVWEGKVQYASAWGVRSVKAFSRVSKGLCR